jgi:hypothetical protein
MPHDTPAAGDVPVPRFAATGPDAEEYGASAGYPKGDRSTFWNIRALVGSHSHFVVDPVEDAVWKAPRD